MDKLRKELLAKKLSKLKTDNKPTVIMEQKPVKPGGKNKPKTAKQLKQDMEEDKSIRAFFKNLPNIPDEQLVQAFEIFGSDSKANWNRKRLFSKIITKLPLEFYQDLAESYIIQERKNLEDFYITFVETPTVAVAIKKKEELADQKYDELQLEELTKKKERDRLRKINLQLFGDDDSDDDYVKPSVPPGPKPQIRLVDVGPNGEFIDVEFPAKQPMKLDGSNYVDKMCLEYRYNLPWIQGIVTKTFIASPNGGIIDKTSDLYKYIETGKNSKTRQEVGANWYSINNKFSLLMCNNNSYKRIQDGNILTSFTENGEPVSLMIGYETTRGFIVQDEKIFLAEKDYKKERDSSLVEKITILLNSPVTSKVENFGIDKLSNTLHDIAPDITDYGIYKPGYTKTDTTYIVKAITTISKETSTVREFLSKLGGVIVYLTTKLGHDIFKKRVIEEYYLPEILVNLSAAEKLPEIFEDPRVTEEIKNYNTRFLTGELNYFISTNGQAIYMIEHSTERSKNIFYKASYDGTKKEKNLDWKSVCINKDQVRDIPDEQITYYKEDEKVYCLVIEEILEQISSGEKPINPYTKQTLRSDFLTRFKQLYSNKRKKDEIAPLKTSPIKTQKIEVILAPGLLNMIVKNILDCEQELTGQECKSLDNPPTRDDEDDEDDNLSNLFSPSSRLDEEDTTNICEHCAKDLSCVKSEYKTKVVADGGFKTIYFCCSSCFEEHDNWPKTNKKKGKKSKKSKKSEKSEDGKKGGRNSTKERLK